MPNLYLLLCKNGKIANNKQYRKGKKRINAPLVFPSFLIDNKDGIKQKPKKKANQAIHIKIDPCLNASSPRWYGSLQLHMCSINSFQYFFVTNPSKKCAKTKI